MKKYIITLLLVLASVCASAQLTIKSPIHPKTEVIATAGNNELNRVGKAYYLYCRSTNQFDELETVFLGLTVETAADTMADIIGMFSKLEVGESVKVEDPIGHEFRIFKYNKKCITLNYEVQAGSRFLKLGHAKYFFTVLASEARNQFVAEQQKK